MLPPRLVDALAGTDVGGESHSQGGPAAGILRRSRPLSLVTAGPVPGRRTVARRKHVEFEDDDGTMLRYVQHPNGGGLVERGAKVHPTAWVAPTAYVDPGA